MVLPLILAGTAAVAVGGLVVDKVFDETQQTIDRTPQLVALALAGAAVWLIFQHSKRSR